MKIVADTNLLLRFILDDDPLLHKLAVDIMERAESVVVTNAVLCELVWELRRNFGVSRQNLAATIVRLRETRNMVFDSAALDAGLSMLEAGADFADGIIAYEGRWLGGDTFVSFDKKAVAAIAQQGQKATLLA